MTHVNAAGSVNFHRGVSAQAFGRDVLLELGINPEDGQINGQGVPERKLRHNGVVRPGQMGNFESVFHHQFHL